MRRHNSMLDLVVRRAICIAPVLMLFACAPHSKPTANPKHPAPLPKPPTVTRKTPAIPKQNVPAITAKKASDVERPAYSSPDGTISVEVVDDIPAELKPGRDYRITHYVRNLSTHQIRGQLATAATYRCSQDGTMIPRSKYIIMEPGASLIFSRVVRFDEVEEREPDGLKPRLKFQMDEGGATYYKSRPKDMGLGASYTFTPAGDANAAIHVEVPNRTFDVLSEKFPRQNAPTH